MIEPREYRVEQFTPQSPAPHLIRMLHREHADHVTFANEREGKWTFGANVPAAALDREFPGIAPALDADGFFSILGMYGTSRSPSPWTERLRRGRLSSHQVQWITAHFVDLDVYSIGLDPTSVMREVRQFEVARVIPIVSIVVRSGRGLWFLWLLRDPLGKGPIRARERFVRDFQDGQRSLSEHFLHLGVDLGARDVCRVMRVPGSRNSKSGTRVEFDVRIDSVTGEPIAYTQNEMREALGLAPRPETRRVRGPDREVDPEAAKVGRLGPWRRAWLNVLRFVALVLLLRPGGLRCGIRHRAGWLLALWLRTLGVSRTTATELVCALFERYSAQYDATGHRDPIGRRDAKHTVDSVYDASQRGYRVRNQTVADSLEVTEEEAARIAAILGRGWPAAACFRTPGTRGPSRRQARAYERQDALRRLLPGTGPRPSLEKLRALLADVGLRASPNAIRRDLKALAAELGHLEDEER